MKFIFLGTMSLILSINAQAKENSILSCLNTGGGYLTQSISISEVQDEGDFIVIKAERFSPLKGVADPKFTGIPVEGNVAKRLEIEFERSQCIFKPATEAHVALLACATGISKNVVHLELLDGTKKTMVLADNSRIEVSQLDKHTVSAILEQTVRVSLDLDRKHDFSLIGFDLARDCK